MPKINEIDALPNPGNPASYCVPVRLCGTPSVEIRQIPPVSIAEESLRPPARARIKFNGAALKAFTDLDNSFGSETEIFAVQGPWVQVRFFKTDGSTSVDRWFNTNAIPFGWTG